MTFQNSLKSLVLLSSLMAFLVSCGGSKPMVENVHVSTSVVDGDIWVDLSADLSIGNVSLPNAAIPIILPKTGQMIGTLSLQTGPEGQNQLAVNVNVSETANLDLNSARLPNGSLLPIIGDRQVIVVPIGHGGEVYISILENQAAIGIAIPIKTLDAVGAKVGTAVLMPSFFKNDIFGAAGLFTSRNQGENGIALIADVSSKLGSFVKEKMLEDHSGRMALEEISDARPQVLSSRTERKINRAMYKLHKKKTQLELD